MARVADTTISCRLLPGVAPPRRPRSAHLHRREPTTARQSRRAGSALGQRERQGGSETPPARASRFYIPALLDHLTILTRNTIRATSGMTRDFDVLATPIPTRRQAFELLATPSAITLT